MKARKSLYQITWPIFIEILMFMLMGVADTFMLSAYSDNAVAAVGMSNQVLNLVGVLINIVALGVTVLISQYIGAKLYKKSHEVAITGLAMNFAFGLLFAAFLYFFSSDILRLINTPKEIITISMQYTKIVSFSLFMWALTSTGNAILRSNGYSKVPMFLVMGANVINVIGNYLLIFGIGIFPELGPIGAAISTTFARFILVICAMIVLYRTLDFSVTKEFRRNLSKYIKNLLKVGIPSAAENFSYTVSQTVIVGMIATLGTTSITTRIYTFNIAMFIFIFSVAVGNGNQIITGYFVGEKDFDGAYKNTLKVNFITMALSMSIAIIFALLGPSLIRLLTDNEEIIKVVTILLWLEVILEPGRTINLVVIQSLRAAGDTIFPVVMAVISMWGFAVFGSYLSITFGFGLIGVWLAYISDEWVRGISMLLRWRSKKWQSKSFVTEE